MRVIGSSAMVVGISHIHRICDLRGFLRLWVGVFGRVGRFGFVRTRGREYRSWIHDVQRADFAQHGLVAAGFIRKRPLTIRLAFPDLRARRGRGWRRRWGQIRCGGKGRRCGHGCRRRCQICGGSCCRHGGWRRRHNGNRGLTGYPRNSWCRTIGRHRHDDRKAGHQTADHPWQKNSTLVHEPIMLRRFRGCDGYDRLPNYSSTGSPITGFRAHEMDVPLRSCAQLGRKIQCRTRNDIDR
jgi:hypothetical protein